MASTSLKIGGKGFVVIPTKEYATLKRRAASANGGVRAAKRNGKHRASAVETHSDRRIAEFLLSNAVDRADYRRAVEEVRRMGLDAAKIDHIAPADGK